MDPTALIVALIAGFGISTLLLVFLAKDTAKRKAEARLQSLVDETSQSAESTVLQRSRRSASGNNSGLPAVMEKMLDVFNVDREKYYEDISLKFAQAGIRSENAVTYYIFFKRFGWAAGALLGAALLITSPEGDFTSLLMVIFGAALLFGIFTVGADLYLKNRKQKRQYILQRSFPDGLDLILICVEAGLALDAALARVTRELDKAHPELCYELNKTRTELTLLNDRSKALHNLAERTDLVSVRSLVSALLQSERFGTSLTETLRVLAQDYRNTRMMQAENKANRLPALITIPLVSLMIPALIIILMTPAILQLARTWSASGM